MIHPRILILFLSAGFLLGQSAVTLSLREAVSKALATHPEITASAQRVAIAVGEKRQAGLPIDPKLVLQTENIRFHGQPPLSYSKDVDQFAYLQKTFETAGKRKLRTEVSGQQVSLSELDQELLRRGIAARVSLAYWNAAGSQRVHRLLIESGETLKKVIEFHHHRVEEGVMAEADLLRVRLEGDRMQITINMMLLEAERARIHLFREMGQIEFPPVDFADPLEGSTGLDGLTSMVTVAASEALARRTEVKMARLQLDQARSNERLQQANAIPNFDLLFGFKRTAGFNTMIGGLQFDLPLQNRKAGTLEAAASRIRMAEASLAAVEAVVRAEVASAIVDYEIRRRQVSTSLKPLVEQSAQTYRIAEAAYAEGGTDLLRLLDAQRLQNDALTTYARSLAELRQSRVNLDLALGVEP
ncbi:MAG: TolC family protein [Acidobacteriia bacterium]|nr:TolC family protein [Terriglobia bacterium]